MKPPVLNKINVKVKFQVQYEQGSMNFSKLKKKKFNY